MALKSRIGVSKAAKILRKTVTPFHDKLGTTTIADPETLVGNVLGCRPSGAVFEQIPSGRPAKRYGLGPDPLMDCLM